MQSFRVEHVFECNQTTFWEKVFFNEEYNRRLFYDELHFVEWKELEQRDDGAAVHRFVRAMPPMGDLPGALKAVIGDSAGYEERGKFVRATNRYEADVKTNVLSDKLKIELQFSTQPVGEDRCKRLVEASVTARVMMVGGLLEQRMITDLRRSYEKSASFTNQFLAEKGWR